MAENKTMPTTASGQEGDAALLGFAVRKTGFTLCVPAGFDLMVLEQLCAASIVAIQRRYPPGG